MKHTQHKISFRGLKGQRGVAMVEMLPMLVIFIMLFGLLLGFWSAIHRGILQNISARHYAFEIINNRTHFIYHRDHGVTDVRDVKIYYKRPGFRYFAIVESQPNTPNFGPRLIHSKKEINLFDLGSGSRSIDDFPPNASPKANPIRLKQGYGICIDYECGTIADPP